MPNKNENANVAGEKRDGHPGVALVYGCGVVTPWAYIPGTGLKSPVESVQEGPKKHKKAQVAPGAPQTLHCYNTHPEC